MSLEYEVVEAKTHKEAIEKSQFFVGQRAVVKRVRPIANRNGTWSVFVDYEVTEKKGE